jgi:hypothetical protein
MKKALISPNEVVTNFDETTGQRVAQVEDAQNIFDVASPLHWIDCADDVVADQYYFDTTANAILEKPVPPPPEPPANTTNTVV